MKKLIWLVNVNAPHASTCLSFFTTTPPINYSRIWIFIFHSRGQQQVATSNWNNELLHKTNSHDNTICCCCRRRREHAELNFAVVFWMNESFTFSQSLSAVDVVEDYTVVSCRTATCVNCFKNANCGNFLRLWGWLYGACDFRAVILGSFSVFFRSLSKIYINFNSIGISMIFAINFVKSSRHG